MIELLSRIKNHYLIKKWILGISQMQHRTDFKISKSLTFIECIWNQLFEFLVLVSFIEIFRYCWNANNYYLKIVSDTCGIRSASVFRYWFPIADMSLLPSWLSRLISPMRNRRRTTQSQVDPSPQDLLILVTVWEELWPCLNSCRKQMHFSFFSCSKGGVHVWN